LIRHKSTITDLQKLTFEEAYRQVMASRERKRRRNEQKIKEAQNPEPDVVNDEPQLESHDTSSSSSSLVARSAESVADVASSRPTAPSSATSEKLEFMPTQDWVRNSGCPISAKCNSLNTGIHSFHCRLFCRYWKPWHLRYCIVHIYVSYSFNYDKIEKMCQEQQMNDESVLEYLQSGTLVGLLPVPHALFVRRFQFTEGIHVWFTSYMWGVVYLRSIGGTQEGN
jgi:hypothetical protein